MHGSKHGQATGPKAPRNRAESEFDAESDPRSAPHGRPDHDESGTAHPVDRVYGLLGYVASTDELLEELRGR